MTYNLQFEGYWRDEKSGAIPNKSGVYCVYACTYNPQKKNVSLRQLLYIGQAKTVRERIQGHEMKENWESYLQDREELCYTFAEVDSNSLDRIEAALIFKHKPPENTEFANRFPFETTQVVSEGKTALLNTDFEVARHD